MSFTPERFGARGLARLATAASTLAIAVAFSGTAQAQSTPAGAAAPQPGQPDAATKVDDQTIVVTGIRAGLKKSIDLKRKEQGIVEAVSAEDIGKLPDVSIGESIARLPGLAAQRVNGRAQVISIRGLSPDFTTTLLNGRQQASSGDNRAVEFDQYPSELLSSVVVYKTPDANIAGMGLSGTADLRTVRPLSFGKRVIAINVRGELDGTKRTNHDVRNYGNRISFSYIDKITPELGVAFGFAHLDSPSHNDHFKGYGYEQFGCCSDGGDYGNGRVSPKSEANDYFLTGQEIFATSRLNKRNAAIGILEWQPSDKIHTIVDLYYSKFKQKETTRGLQWFSNVWADNQHFTNVTGADYGGSRLGVSGTDTGVSPQLRNDYNTRNDTLFSAGLNNEYKFDDHLSLRTDLSYSSNKRDESITETYAGYGCCTTRSKQNDGRVFDTFTWDLGDSSGVPQYTTGLNYADASNVSLGDRAPWGGWGHDGANKQPHVKEKVYSADGDLHYEAAGFFEAFDLGANFTRRDKSKFVDEFDLRLKNGELETLVDPSLLVDPTTFGFAGLGGVLSYNVPGAVDRYYNFAVLEDANHYDKAWSIREDVLTFKARAQFAAGNLHGNLGLQVVRQKQESTGARINFTVTPPIITPVTSGATYTDVLPSLNSYYDFGGGHRLRFAASKTMARPRMDDLRANLTPSFNSGICQGNTKCVPGYVVNPFSAGGGNPQLKPWRATALDLSYEWYGGKSTYFALAGFYKKLNSYIYNQTTAIDFSSFPIPTTASQIPAGVIISPMGTLDLPQNGKGGTIKGFEVSGALEFNRITRLLNGFGVLGSLSMTTSNLNPTSNPGAPTRIAGLSKWVYNLTGYYENGGFQFRTSYRYRSGFKGEVVQLFAKRGQTEILADKQVDAQLGYTFPKGSSLADLGVLLQVNNVTNSPYRTRLGLDSGGPTTANGAKFTETYEKYGRQFLLGFNYRF